MLCDIKIFGKRAAKKKIKLDIELIEIPQRSKFYCFDLVRLILFSCSS